MKQKQKMTEKLREQIRRASARYAARKKLEGFKKIYVKKEEEIIENKFENNEKKA